MVRVDLADDTVTRLVHGAVFSDVAVSPDGATVLRCGTPRIAAARRPARCPDSRPGAGRAAVAGDPGRGTAGDHASWSACPRPPTTGSSRLVAPPPGGCLGGEPAPLVVFVHGGPLGTWAGWHWRWNANLLVERGYAVLMPDPALSTGYGQAFIDRGWGRSGERPYTDVMAAVDGVLERPTSMRRGRR